MLDKPPFRKLRGYAFDPSLSLNIDTALINNITYHVPWEDSLEPGPCGEYIEVIDYDPTVDKWYKPVDLNEIYIVAQDGLEPNGSNPQFHQQMVYAVVMTTIRNFESALGRPVLWSPRIKRVKKEESNEFERDDEYVPKLKIYPHAMRDANAYYSPQKKALLFGYFTAQPVDITLQMPDSLTFTCLSHDVIAHETTHAILDGLYHQYTDDSNPDVLAFHEAFSDVVALFQHFTYPEVLKNQIAATRGDLSSQNLLGKLAQEFGVAIGSYGSLRDAIGEVDKDTKEWKPHTPSGDEYQTIMEPHARGAILVSAIFDAFITIYKNRVKDLLRIASNGTGILPKGELQTDLVNRLAEEASKSASHILKMCIRAIDYCPPLDITFGDFLRAVITADVNLVVNDRWGYRIAFIDAFRKRGIYPHGIKSLSVESLIYPTPAIDGIETPSEILSKFLREYSEQITYINDREKIFKTNRDYIAGQYNKGEKIINGLHRRITSKFSTPLFEKLTGLCFNERINFNQIGIAGSSAYKHKGTRPAFEVHSIHYSSRGGPDGLRSDQAIVTLIQTANVEQGSEYIKFKINDNDEPFQFKGGCTIIFDLQSLTIKHIISKPLLDVEELDREKYVIDTARAQQSYNHKNGISSEVGTFRKYFSESNEYGLGEPFSFLHIH